jgi:Domain of unknown function (DUF1330)
MACTRKPNQGARGHRNHGKRSRGVMKEYAPVVRKVFEGKGAKYVSRGGDVVSIEGTEPPTRLTIIVSVTDALRASPSKLGAVARSAVT